ncbi:MAG TPA: riboflavin synthase [Desulfobacterales bacterium]|nr:riboflavin synthase [Desulfobacterales bacterium]
MFTGIIEGLGAVAAIRPVGQGKRLAITADFELAGTKVGDSIAVSGACLTAVAIAGRQFEIDVSPETLARTTLGAARVGERVNLERALRLSDRIDGHLVSGHTDGTGVIASREAAGNAVIVTVAVPEALTRYMIVKGSVAVDGVSLTINRMEADRFSVSIIPYTSGLTTIGFKQKGEGVNIEVDMIGKYVEKFLSAQTGRAAAPSSGVSMELLAKAGYIK